MFAVVAKGSYRSNIGLCETMRIIGAYPEQKIARDHQNLARRELQRIAEHYQVEPGTKRYDAIPVPNVYDPEAKSLAFKYFVLPFNMAEALPDVASALAELEDEPE